MKKLNKQDKIKLYRAQMLEEQDWLCPLCGNPVLEAQASLDHDHFTGRCRAALHRNCNQIEGRIAHWAKRSGIPRIQLLAALIQFWLKDYSDNPMHPLHKTSNEKQLLKLKAGAKKLKTKSARLRYHEQIRVLEDRVKAERGHTDVRQADFDS